MGEVTSRNAEQNFNQAILSLIETAESDGVYERAEAYLQIAISSNSRDKYKNREYYWHTSENYRRRLILLLNKQEKYDEALQAWDEYKKAAPRSGQTMEMQSLRKEIKRNIARVSSNSGVSSEPSFMELEFRLPQLLGGNQL